MSSSVEYVNEVSDVKKENTHIHNWQIYTQSIVAATAAAEKWNENKKKSILYGK